MRPAPAAAPSRRGGEAGRGGQIMTGGVHVAGVETDADPLVTSHRVEVGAERGSVRRERVGHRIEYSPDVLPSLDHRGVHPLPSTAEPACNTTPRASIAAPRRSENPSAAAERSSVCGDGEPKLIKYGACTKTGTAQAAAARLVALLNPPATDTWAPIWAAERTPQLLSV